MSQSGSYSFDNHQNMIPGDSKFLILCISMYNGLVMECEQENRTFLNPRFKGINEKLGASDKDQDHDRQINPGERVDQLANFYRLTHINWKNRYHEFKIMGTFIETILKIFDFKMEVCIHDLVFQSREICLVQTGFIEESEEDTAPLFEVYQSKDFKNKAFSKFLTEFFTSRGLECVRKKKEPENFRLRNFLEDEREGIQLYVLSLFVNKAKFLADFEHREDGFFVLKKIMDEFYLELEEVFKTRNAVVSSPKYQLEENQISRERTELRKKKWKSHYLKADGDQFYIRWDWQGIELLDFVHLKIWYYPDEWDIDHVLLTHLPDLEFNYASCNKKEFEAKKDLLNYVL